MNEYIDNRAMQNWMPLAF